jgi:hypothetical protein
MSAPIPPDELSVRSPEEILAMNFLDSDLYLGDGLFAKGQCGAVIGPAGVGKSRIVTQIACSFILGTPFLGIEVGAADKNACFFNRKTQIGGSRISSPSKLQPTLTLNANASTLISTSKPWKMTGMQTCA